MKAAVYLTDGTRTAQLYETPCRVLGYEALEKSTSRFRFIGQKFRRMISSRDPGKCRCAAFLCTTVDRRNVPPQAHAMRHLRECHKSERLRPCLRRERYAEFS
jgi:hypothetical protein